jgi:hypothetical protein
MNSMAKTLAAGVMGAVGVLTLMNVASAQEATTDTPAVEAPAAGTAADQNCPERDGAGSGGSSSGTGSTDSTGSNVGFRRL